MRFVLALLWMLFSLPAMAAVDPSSLATLPILQDGRIKPLATYARLQHGAIADKGFVTTGAAMAFMADALFDPAEAAEKPVIAIRNKAVRAYLGLPEGKDRFALAEIAGPLFAHEEAIGKLLAADPKTHTRLTRDLIAVYDDVVGYTQMLRAFTAVLPLAQSLPEPRRAAYGLEGGGALTFLDLQPAEERIRKDVQTLLKRKGDDPDKYSDEERALAYTLYQIDELRSTGASSVQMRLIPGWSEEWLSPWQMLLSGQGSPEGMASLRQWQDIASAWREGDQKSFDSAAERLKSRMEMRPDASAFRLFLERVYTEVRPIALSGLFYLAAIGAWFFGRDKASLHLGWAALFVHGFAIVLRVLITVRPPIGTLFESILFAGFIATACGLFMAHRVKKPWLAACVSGLGAALQILAMGFVHGDTLAPLQAVLNTPFWLATHVVVITAGYGVCLLTALMAHGALWRRDNAFLTRAVIPASLVALLLTAVGTILGGLWADQSWGRFWGWDPKENGALLIVLWLSWILHARLSAHMTERTWLAGFASLGIVVATAWFGVNLLSTGLHSYGFVNGIATGLFGYIAAQTALIAWLWWRRKHAA